MKEIVDSWIDNNPMLMKNCKTHYIAYRENYKNYIISCCTRPDNYKSYCLTKDNQMVQYEQSLLKEIYKELSKRCQVKN